MRVRSPHRAASIAACAALLAPSGCDEGSAPNPPTEGRAARPATPTEEPVAPVAPAKLTEPAAIESVTDVTGTCLRLVVGGQNARGCKGVVLNTTYSDGRSSFAVFDPAGERLVSFSGVSGDDVRNGDHIVQPVDGVTLSQARVEGPQSERIRAIGACRYTNPFTGPATLSCLAETASGLWSMEFRTDGKPPNVETFDEEE